jgi:hypothetical protein
MKKEQLKQLIKQELEEAVVAEHDKAKVLQAMLKAGSNKAEAQALLKKHYAYVDKKYADSPASKKAEIIVTLAGTASEGAINDSKTINVRHKTTKKQLDIPDDPDTIKKYKKLGYTLWIGSRGKLNEKSGSYREAELKKVAQMTDRNQHLEARHFVAKKGGYTKHVKAYTALIALQDALGHTPRGAEQVRSDLDKDLKKYLSKDVDNWKEIWGNL